ncbi:MAG: flagella basal body P-ring formation protein FlgA [Fimbriimonadaceae bacterium]
MTNLLILAISLHAALAPVKVHVDGVGYLRFVRDGRVVYAKAATLVNVNGELGFEGAKVLPEIEVPTDLRSISIDLQGNVQAGNANLGRLVLAVFPAGSTSSTTDDFFTFAESPTLANPGEGTAGVIRVDNQPVAVQPVHKPVDVKPAVKERKRPAPRAASALLSKRSTPPVGTSVARRDPAGLQIEILVRQHSEVVGDAFTLGDIATIAGPDNAVADYKKVSIGATAIAGVNRVIDPRYVALKLRGAGHPEGSYVLVIPPGATVARKTKTIAAQDIINLAIQAAQQKSGAKIDFRVDGVVRPIVASAGDIVLETSDPEQTARGYVVVVTARSGDTIVGTQTVTVVPPAQLGVVKAGDTVKVVLKAGAAVIEVDGRAITAGFVGQKIKVSITAYPNSGSGKTTTHTGTVIDAGKVEVDL